jgi:hypothetical protein
MSGKQSPRRREGLGDFDGRVNGGEIRQRGIFVLVCMRRKTLILGDQGLVRFYRVACDADQGQILNCRSRWNLFSVIVLRSMVS